MSDFGTPLTDGQWSRIRQIVHDEALRARVAASFLPLYGPLPAGATTATSTNFRMTRTLIVWSSTTSQQSGSPMCQ